MPSLLKLILVFEEAHRLLVDPQNDFAWSSWENCEDALAEVDGMLSVLRRGVLPEARAMEVLFAPTGPLQEVSLSSGWGEEFIALSEEFEEAMGASDT